MSHFLFGSRSGEAMLGGEERANMSLLSQRLASTALESAFHYEHEREPRIMKYVPADQWLWKLLDECRMAYDADAFKAVQMWESRFNTWLGAFDTEFEIDGARFGTRELALNTMLSMGNDALCLLARLHGQAENELFVRAPNRAWLADIIEDGRKRGLMRGGLRSWGTWESVAEFLRSSKRGAVVISHSSNYGECGGSLQRLRAREKSFEGIYSEDWTYELRPERFREIRFLGGMSAFQLADRCWVEFSEEQQRKGERQLEEARANQEA